MTGPATVDFATQIAPIFKEKCEVCHRATAPLGGFSVSSYADIVKGGSHGSVLLAGRPDGSALIGYLTGKRDLMPKGGPPLPADQIALIRTWIAEGARQQISGPPAAAVDTGTGASLPGGRAVTRPGTGARAAANRLPRRGITPPPGPALLEAYSGHLVPNDLSFTLRLHLDKSALAVWTLAPGREVRYAGTYTGEDGSYAISLTQTGSPATDVGKTITIELLPRGPQETGVYGLDGARPRREIAELNLSETRTSDKPSRPVRARKKNPQNRRRRW
jgi:hypothetical protein